MGVFHFCGLGPGTALCYSIDKATKAFLVLFVDDSSQIAHFTILTNKMITFILFTTLQLLFLIIKVLQNIMVFAQKVLSCLLQHIFIHQNVIIFILYCCTGLQLLLESFHKFCELFLYLTKVGMFSFIPTSNFVLKVL